MNSYSSGGGYYNTGFQQPMMGTTPMMTTPVMGTPMMGTPMMSSGVGVAPVMGAPMMGTPVMGTPVMGTPVMGTPVMPVMPVASPMMPGGVRGVPGCIKCMGTGMKMSKKWGGMKPCKTCMRMLRIPGYF